MAKQEVLDTTCDNCGFNKREVVKSAKVDFTLPPNWLHVVGTRNGGTIFDLDMCPDCTQMILAAGGLAPASTKAGKRK